jgi:hypothetical protein
MKNEKFNENTKSFNTFSYYTLTFVVLTQLIVIRNIGPKQRSIFIINVTVILCFLALEIIFHFHLEYVRNIFLKRKFKKEVEVMILIKAFLLWHTVLYLMIIYGNYSFNKWIIRITIQSFSVISSINMKLYLYLERIFFITCTLIRIISRVRTWDTVCQ